MQALYLLALLPVAETNADPNSYGFRPKRSTADAIEQCFTVVLEQQRYRSAEAARTLEIIALAGYGYTFT